MKRSIYAIHDALNGFGSPFVDTNDATAKRNFSFAVNNNNDMSFSPSDYDLYKVGEFDHETGVLIPLSTPLLIVKGISIFSAKE